jgi:type VI secretion system secreted protein Hcp
MRRPSRGFVLKVAAPSAVGLAAAAAVGIAAIPSTDGTIHACYDPTSTPPGQVRIIDADNQQCAAPELALDWNQRGPQGPPGPTGPQGESGEPGGSSPGDTGTTPSDTFPTPTQAGGPSADVFLKLDGIPGESTDDGHKREIDVSSVAIGLGRGGDGTGSTGAPAPSTAATGGSAARRARLYTLRLDKVYDASSPKLLQAAATGRRIKSAVLTFRRTSDNNVDFLTYTLGDVQVTSYDQGGKDGDDRDLGALEEEIGLSAAQIRVTERTVDSDGKPGPVVTANWSVGQQRRP